MIYYYLLGIAVSWAGFPFVCFVSNRLNWKVDKIQVFYTVVATIVYAILTYLGTYDFGEKDRRPYKWSRYKGKGLVCGLIAFVIIYGIEAIFIYSADKFALVQHPILNIQGLHGYITQICYMPFFWVYKLLNYDIVIPSVNYLTGLIPGVFIILINGFAYWMGYTSRVILKKKPHGKVADLLFYRGFTHMKQKKEK